MTLQLEKGEFSPKDAIELITQMLAVKIKYHENKINIKDNEEDCKNREAKIKCFQKELFKFRQYIKSNDKNVKIEAIIKIK